MKISGPAQKALVWGALCAGLLLPACHKKPVIQPEQGITQTSYSVRVYGYRTSFEVKTTPAELEHFLLKDLSWMNKFSSFLQFKVTDLKPGTDMSVSGSSLRVNINMLGLTVPSRVVTLKYVSQKELWLMIHTGESWMLARVEVRPSAGGSLVTLNTLGNVSQSAAKLVDTLEFIKVAAGRIDYAMANIQAQYDPSLDPKELTKAGLRGQLYDKPFQAFESSTWISASPDKVAQRALEPENFKAILNNNQVTGLAECLYEPENRPKWQGDASDFIYCPHTSIKMAGIKWDTPTFALIQPGDFEEFLNNSYTIQDIFLQLQLFGKPEKGGTRIWIRLTVEPPGSTTTNLMEALMSISGIPQLINNILLDIKKRTEIAV